MNGAQVFAALGLAFFFTGCWAWSKSFDLYRDTLAEQARLRRIGIGIKEVCALYKYGAVQEAEELREVVLHEATRSKGHI